MMENMETENIAAESSGSSAATNTGGEKPLLDLLRNLVSLSNSESNAMVENTQLMAILRQELDMQLHTLTDLEIDIYMNVLKAFFKLWPRWDDFDKLMKERSNDAAVKEKLLMEEYSKLKDYLKRKLDYTQTQIGPILSKRDSQRAARHQTVKPTIPNGELAMEVCCSRNQLNRLFYNKPHPQTLTIFHVSEEPASSKISLNAICFKHLLNWPHVTVSVSLNNFDFVRRNTSHLAQTLINRKLPQRDLHPKLPDELYFRNISRKKYCDFRKTFLLSYLTQVIQYIEKTEMPEDRRTQLVDLFNEIRSDMLMLNSFATMGCEYQFFLNKYKYVRYLSNTDYTTEEAVAPGGAVDKMKECINPNDFDLHLEEVLSPAIAFQMPKFAVNFFDNKPTGRTFKLDYSCFTDATSSWLCVECNWCKKKFEGFLTIYSAVQHFNEEHGSEPDWQCTNCNKSFTMMFLAENRWQHTC